MCARVCVCVCVCVLEESDREGGRTYACCSLLFVCVRLCVSVCVCVMGDWGSRLVARDLVCVCVCVCVCVRSMWGRYVVFVSVGCNIEE